ncbi:MarP family serine protease [Corynebacterium pyruviciproducens]|uniref:MarP family serine protease n=1 Tax=Corynebacterium pyruviciproducens TaxID=598660 RepID=UPI0023F55137|nr:MarP family serine protease [Corynebacterium pyruviciproducens]MDK6567001.1 MarP family serine protease [Corynebacterium pyruviciproducens]MDK7215279.1 MarP family serine protease [Corynebacterium pyruviciproducens]
MSPALIADLIIAFASCVTFFFGWRQGAFASVLSAVGVVSGIVLSVALLPLVSNYTANPTLTLLLGIGVMVLIAGIGNLLGGLAGSRLRQSIRTRTAMTVDSLLGAVFQVFALLLVVWFVATPLVGRVTGPVGEGLSNSRVLTAVDQLTPPVIDNLPARLAATLSESGLPPLVSPFTGAREVEPPNILIDDTAMVDRVRPSVVYVLADAPQCSRRLMGSGFVISPDTILTNAHVVAGTDTVHVETVNGTVEATVVFYDPDTDLAVLHSAGLDLPALQWAEDAASTGDDAVVMGFPEGGPFEARPVRIRDKIIVNGPNIYATTRVDREAYSLRGTIRHGNSGGPLLTTDGDVLGVIFGTAVDESETGYALSADEVISTIGEFSTAAVDTGACVA